MQNKLNLTVKCDLIKHHLVQNTQIQLEFVVITLISHFQQTPLNHNAMVYRTLACPRTCAAIRNRVER